MPDLEKTQHHRVYRTEVLGDTMVVTLMGDAVGFNISAVHNEMSTIVAIAQDPAVKHLVIDMSGNNYYGTLILGEIMNLGQVVRRKGGRTALAGMSSDMRELLRIMHLDTWWEAFPSCSAALRAIAAIPWRTRLRPFVKPTTQTLLVLGAIALYVFVPRPDPTPFYYAETVKIWTEANRLKSLGAGDSEWQIFAERAKSRIQELSPVLNKLPGSHARQNILFALRDYIPPAIDQRLKPDAEDTIRVNYHLALAQAHVRKRPLPPLPRGLGGTGDPLPPQIETSPAP